MARNDGIHRTVARNNNLSASQIANAQRHNEREKESYTNPDIVPERLDYNVHYKSPTGSYAEMFANFYMERQGEYYGFLPDDGQRIMSFYAVNDSLAVP